jgi:hypothetical protein
MVMSVSWGDPGIARCLHLQKKIHKASCFIHLKIRSLPLLTKLKLSRIILKFNYFSWCPP